MRIPIHVALGAVIAITVGAVATPASAQVVGDGIVFVVLQGTEVSILGSDDQRDKIIFVGRASETTGGGICALGTSFPVQSIVIVDPGTAGGRATRRAQVITISQDTPVPPGTRLTDLINGGTCEIAGLTYDRYLGFVE